MHQNSPFFIRFGSTQSMLGGAGALIMIPGILLTLMAIAILIWPDLLAYLVATILLFAGTGLTAWGWTLRRARRMSRMQPGNGETIHYTIR